MFRSHSENAREKRRVHLVRELGVMDDGQSQEAYDRIARIAKQIFATEIVLITFMDGDRQWFKSHLGTSDTENARDKTFCTHTIAATATLVVPDALLDERFKANPWVMGPPHLRFYAGAPLLTYDGLAIGTLCLADYRSREFSQEDRETLEDLAALVMNQVKLDRGLTFLDATTRLPNRVRYAEALRAHLAGPQDEDGDWAVLVELMGPQEVNEAIRALGLPYYHDYLFQGAAVLRDILGNTPIYHIGSTHLAFFLPPTDPFPILREVYDRLRVPFITAQNVPGLLRPGCGVRKLTRQNLPSSEVIRTLLLASQEARQNGRGIAVYDPSADAAHQRAFRLLADFPNALEKNELFLVYQPRVDAQTDECTSAEALLRWRHPVHGMISPGEFIPLIAKTALMRDTTDWVLQNVAKQLAEWRTRGIAIRCSFNISAVNLIEDDFVDRIGEAIAKNGLPANVLEVELVEDVSLLHDGISLNRLRQIHDLGVTIAIDDFGSGYSNLSYLLELPATVLKLDRSIVAGILVKESYATAVGSIITMAHQLGYSIIAEGIETVEIQEKLRAWECDELQGFLFSRPLEREQFEAWYRRHSV